LLSVANAPKLTPDMTTLSLTALNFWLSGNKNMKISFISRRIALYSGWTGTDEMCCIGCKWEKLEFRTLNTVNFGLKKWRNQD
jgi:hypothetical protein